MTASAEKVYALIPNTNDPELHLLTKEGDFPSRERKEGETYEHTLHAIGSQALRGGEYLSVYRRRASLENALCETDPDAVQVFAYETRPLRSDIELAEGYSWGYREEPIPTK